MSNLDLDERLKEAPARVDGGEIAIQKECERFVVTESLNTIKNQKK